MENAQVNTQLSSVQPQHKLLVNFESDKVLGDININIIEKLWSVLALTGGNNLTAYCFMFSSPTVETDTATNGPEVQLRAFYPAKQWRASGSRSGLGVSALAPPASRIAPGY